MFYVHRTNVARGLTDGIRRLLHALLYFLSGFVPRNRRKILFGAWLGKKFADNPKYLLLFLAGKESELDLVWIAEYEVRSAIPANLPVRFVPLGSFAAYLELLTAGTCFVTHGFADLGRFNLLRGACRVYLGHGLAIKHMGAKDRPLANRLIRAGRRVLRQMYSFDYYIASSSAHRRKLLIENATCNASPDQIIDAGQPRVDFLIQNSFPECVKCFRASFIAEHEIPVALKVITYLPTFRDKGNPVAFSFSTLDAKQAKRLEQLLRSLDAVIVEKSHFTDILRDNVPQQIKLDRVFQLNSSASIDTQELLLVSDLLITDYSGCYVDYLVLNRPVLHFTYDRAQYENTDRGLYFNLDEVAGGPIVDDFEKLCSAIEECWSDSSGAQYDQASVRKHLAEFERGTACQQIARTVLAINIHPDTAR